MVYLPGTATDVPPVAAEAGAAAGPATDTSAAAKAPATAALRMTFTGYPLEEANRWTRNMFAQSARIPKGQEWPGNPVRKWPTGAGPARHTVEP
ncbi:hypothetical protein GCM10010315_02990 [Streptomyces luteosporeus]|uniref:Uncharacterized protein n=1 Tax=Streptomyces luteosporeus TaxID=173856 RepID=A0ABN3TKS8_9ACTN